MTPSVETVVMRLLAAEIQRLDEIAGMLVEAVNEDPPGWVTLQLGGYAGTDQGAHFRTQVALPADFPLTVLRRDTR